MTDLATLYNNRAFSPLNGPLPSPDSGQQSLPPPHLQLTNQRSQQRQRGQHPAAATLPNAQQLPGKHQSLPQSSSGSSPSLAPAPRTMRSPSSSTSTSSASSSSSTSSGRRGSVASDDGRRRRDRQPARSARAERRQKEGAAAAAVPVTSTVQSAEAAEEEEHRWLLHSSRIARAYSEQLVETESPYYPKLIEQELIVDDSRDEHAEPDSIAILSSEQAAEHESAASSPASPSSAHSSPVIRPPASVSSSRLNPDLISSYEQLAFIRFPPSLWSLLLHRYVYAALGLLQEPWPVWKESRSEDDELWWLWWLWCWQAVWALACVLGLGWLCWLRVVDSESEPLLTRALLSACDVASVCCALLLSHAVLSHRMLGSRVYFLSRNSSSPRNAAAAVNRAVYRSLAALLLIAAAGVYLDTRSAPSSLPSASSSSPVLQPAVLSLQLTAQAWLWLSCVVLLRLQYAAGVCVLVCLVDVHILRVEQARKAVLAAEGDEEGVAAQVVDIELSVQDVADRLGSFVSVLLAACVLSAVTAAVSAADGANATAAAGGGAALRLLYPLLVALFLLQAVTRLNQACSRFRAAVLSFPLLHPRLLPAAATASPAAASVMPPARSSSLWISIPCPEVSLLVCGVRLSYGSLWLFLLLWSALLLWLTQTGRLR